MQTSVFTHLRLRWIPDIDHGQPFCDGKPDLPDILQAMIHREVKGVDFEAQEKSGMA